MVIRGLIVLAGIISALIIGFCIHAQAATFTPVRSCRVTIVVNHPRFGLDVTARLRKDTCHPDQAQFRAEGSCIKPGGTVGVYGNVIDKVPQLSTVRCSTRLWHNYGWGWRYHYGRKGHKHWTRWHFVKTS